MSLVERIRALLAGKSPRAEDGAAAGAFVATDDDPARNVEPRADVGGSEGGGWGDGGGGGGGGDGGSGT